MQSEQINSLRKWCKDEESFQKMKRLVEDLEAERDQRAEALNLLESAIRSDYDAILITELSLEKPGPEIVYVNEGFCKMTGYTKEEVIGETPRILQGPKTDREVLDKLKRRLREGQSFFGQTINYRKDGSEFVNQWDIHPLTDGAGNITHWVSYQHDITKRKRAEEQLMDQKLAFDGLREQSKRTVVDVDVQGNILMANKSFRELIGYGKKELKKIKIWDLFPDKYMYSLKSRFKEVDKDSFFDGEEFKGIIKHKSGVPIQVKGRTEIMDLKDQKLIRAEIENISLQKRIIQTLKKRNYDYARLVKKASEFSYSVTFQDETPVMEGLSEEFPAITGLSNEAIIGKGQVEKFIHKDDVDTFWEHLYDVRKGQETSCSYRLKTGTGEYIEVLDYAKPEWDDQQKSVTGAFCAVSVDEAYQKTEA